MQLGVCAYERGDLDSAEVFFANSAVLAQAQHLERSVMRAQNGLAGVYASRSKFNDALPLFISSLEVAERLGDKKMQIMALSNMGSVAEQLLDEPKALRYYARCLVLADTVTYAQAYETCLCNIAGLYLNQKKFATAAPYVQRALRLNHRTGDAQNRGTMLMALGQIELAQKEPANAETYFQGALELGRKVGDNFLTTRALLLLGKVAEQQHQAAVALRFYQQALPQTLDLGIYEHTKEAYAGLATAYAALGQYDKAFQNQLKQAIYADSALTNKAGTETRTLQYKFETERKEAQNRLQAAQLRTQQQIIRRRNTQLLAGLAVAALLAGLAYLLYNRRRLRREVEFAQERQQLERLRAQAVLEAEETERRRIGADLHDGVGQLLTVARLNLEALGEALPPARPGAEDLLANALSVVDESFREVRSISHNLLPNALLKRGLVLAVRDFLEKVSPGGRLKINLEVVGLDTGPRLPPTVESVLFRVIQELVQNILKHAQATELTLQLIRHPDELTVLVEDNGVGFDPAALGPDAGIGLKNIESRMAYLGGRAEFDSAPGRGTTVTLEVPFEMADAA